MDDIDRVVMGLLEKCKLTSPYPELAGSCVQDLAGIGKVPVTRIQREEAILYPVYSAPV